MAEPELSCRCLVSIEDPAFAEFLNIYAEAIPERERKSPAAIGAMACREDYLLLLLESATGVMGFSVIFLPPRKTFFLLEYMAVHPTQRSRGLGAFLFQEGLERARALPGRSCCLIEVDSPREPTEDRELRQRRERFYRDRGCLRVEGLDYLLPLPGEGAPPAMDLMVHRPEASRTVVREMVQDWLETIYVEVYGCAHGDVRVHAMMRNLDDPIRLG
jgi:GNAT superfamily N-acetyltransferase